MTNKERWKVQKQIVFLSGEDIYVTVTDKAAVVDSWVENIRSMYNGQQVIVGLDSEWRPNQFPFMSNKTAVLQLCVDTNKCLIFQLFYLDRVPQSLPDFLGDPNFTFVGEVARDAEKLRIEYRLHCSNVADVRDITMKRWPTLFYGEPRLKDIANLVPGLRMPKPVDVCSSDWQSRVLDAEQIQYACIDAYASYKIGQRLLNGI